MPPEVKKRVAAAVDTKQMTVAVVAKPQARSIEEVNQQVAVLQLVEKVINSGQAESVLSDDFVENSTMGEEQAEELAVAYESAAEEREREARVVAPDLQKEGSTTPAPSNGTSADQQSGEGAQSGSKAESDRGGLVGG